MLQNYSPEIKNALKRIKADVGDRISVKKGGNIYEGIIMPRIELGDTSSIVIKLDNGYNIGIKYEKGIEINKLKEKTPRVSVKKEKIRFDPKKPSVSILATGGTIASKVDYRTGGVVPITTAEELVSAVPELKEIANIRTRIILSMFSENMQFEHYKIIAKEIAKEIKKGVDGIVITHGTDTMQYTAAMLSFMLQDLPMPVVLVGSQRSSDRGSSDSASNLISAVNFAANGNAAGVFICMHENEDDKNCLIHAGVSVRKMHTSRRDAFRSINSLPVAKVDYETKKIKYLNENFMKRDKKRKLKLKNEIEKKVALIKITPNMDSDVIKFYMNKKYKGLILEGTGLGHAPVTELDKYTQGNRQLFEILKKACSKMIIGMASQCVYGRVNMNLYSTGRDLQTIGIIPCEMLPEVAFMKLAFLLGNYKMKDAKELLNKNLAGEIPQRINVFLV